MGIYTPIQWADSAVNPHMGCGGCELFPTPAKMLANIDAAMKNALPGEWKTGQAKKIFKELIAEAWQELLEAIGEPLPGHSNKVTSTNIYHLRERFAETVKQKHGKPAGKKAEIAVKRQIKCYAAQLHANRACDITKPHRKINSGYAPSFEIVTRFEGRMEEAAKWDDLTGSKRLAKKGRPGKKGRPAKPWLNGLPRLIFVSDMGDSLSKKSDFDFLRNEMTAVETELGRRHLWLWLTKRPQNMRLFAEATGGLPDNVCAMTTVTSDRTLSRIDELRRVEAAFKGLSVEPLWSSVADEIDLDGIDWVIVGGESGGMDRSEPFAIEWARELRDLCSDQNVAFFCKQLGRIPTECGAVMKLSHSHGSDWDEWPADLRVREFPQYFHDYAGVAVSG